jgi:predicted ester cyclase
MSVATTTLPVALRRFIDEVINGHNLDVLDEIMTPGYTNHVAPPELPRGPQGEKLFTQGFLAAFPDTRLMIEDAVAAGNRVAARVTFAGTHTGPFMGMPATGRSFAVPMIIYFGLRDGQISDNWTQVDMLGLLTQLGALPAPQ